MNNTIKYNFTTIESMLTQLDGYKNQLIKAGLKVKYKMFVGNNEYYSIFVVE